MAGSPEAGWERGWSDCFGGPAVARQKRADRTGSRRSRVGVREIRNNHWAMIQTVRHNMKNRTVALKGAVTKLVRSMWFFLLAATLLTGILALAPMACVSEPAPSPDQSAGPAPMGPQEAVSAATKLAQWPAIPQFSTMTGDPSAAAGAVLAYGEAWKYYSDGAMHRNDLPLADDLVWLVIFEGEIYGKCDQPGCSHLVGPWPDWPMRVEEDEWKQSLVVMDAVTGELMMRSVYHEGRLRSTEGLENLERYLAGK